MTCHVIIVFRRIEKEKNALQAEGDDLSVSLETLQKQKVLYNAAVGLFALLVLLLFDLMDFLLSFSKAQSDKQTRALEELLNDHKYQVRIETQTA